MRDMYRSVSSYKANLVRRIQNVDPELGQRLRALHMPWYTITNEAVEGSGSASSTDVFIYDEIGGSFGLDANEFVQELSAIDTETINVRINSPGGNAFDAIAIYNSLVSHSAYVYTYVDALAASAASIIAMAGDEVIMMTGGQLMIHDALSPEMGNAADHRAVADFLDQQSDNIASIYAAKAGGEIPEWRNRMLAETWLTANEAVELGLADAVFLPPKREAPGTKPAPNMPPEPPEPPDPDEPPVMPEEAHDEEVGTSAAMLRQLMGQEHRLLGRGYKYAGRNKAPAPALCTNSQVLSSMFTNLLKG